MGEEIGSDIFHAEDFEHYCRRLAEETRQLLGWFDSGGLSSTKAIAGLELEAWIVDAQQLPAPCNQECIDRIGDLDVVPELAKFNLELNVQPQALAGDGLLRLEQELSQQWTQANSAIADMDVGLVMIGTLPTARQSDFSMQNMSDLKRYRALNEQVLCARAGRPLNLEIQGRQHIRLKHQDVMLEAAATSFQLHLQMTVEEAKERYNAAVIQSAPQVALAANSPYLFGMDLWDETRIPLFEQSVEVGGFDGAARGPVRRVTFGSGYVQNGIQELFQENLAHYPVLLPMLSANGAAHLPHLRLHNGTIWRWNRPLLGFDADGTPHIRMEHRVMPAGPSVIDMIANAAFFYGLNEVLYRSGPAAGRIPFATARDNFYAAARSGLNANVTWLGGNKGSVRDLILQVLLPQAREGLAQLQMDGALGDQYLAIVEQRVKNGQNGATWQRRFIETNGADMSALIRAYRYYQDSGQPVHTWPLPSTEAKV